MAKLAVEFVAFLFRTYTPHVLEGFISLVFLPLFATLRRITRV